MSAYPTKFALLAMCDAASIKVFHINAEWARESRRNGGSTPRVGWYFWTCSPGCLPDSDAFGPYESTLAALRAAYDMEMIGDTP
jgi:hypothetical protein